MDAFGHFQRLLHDLRRVPGGATRGKEGRGLVRRSRRAVPTVPGRVPLNSPASQEDVVGPHHGEGHQALQLGAARRRQLPYVAQQEFPAVPPVVLRLAGPAQRLRPGRLFRRPPQGLERRRLPRHRRRHRGNTRPAASARRALSSHPPGPRRAGRAAETPPQALALSRSRPCAVPPTQLGVPGERDTLGGATSPAL